VDGAELWAALSTGDAEAPVGRGRSSGARPQRTQCAALQWQVCGLHCSQSFALQCTALQCARQTSCSASATDWLQCGAHHKQHAQTARPLRWAPLRAPFGFLV